MVIDSELRVGNKIYCANRNIILTVKEVKERTVRVGYIRPDTNSPHVSLGYYEDFYPMPLTSEVLEKCGFIQGDGREVNKYFWIKRGTQVEVCINPENGVCFLTEAGIGDNDIKLKRTISYLHQLQNLYHSLVGEDLAIEL